ncbi:uncharacterized protein LOC125658886 [Ostrea edulis]|uniref:uncharacterized protein LOC125658886 n=1 Tax=Ostrea edulis TaxID=37623 RepID=UPI00209569F0|nr:uncharacterized protein LOC125658886 [Ostrea edulis]
MAEIQLETQCKPFTRFFYINSTLAPTCILFVCIVILIIFSTSKAIPSPRPVVWGTEAAITFISMIFTFVIWFLVNRNKHRFLVLKHRDNLSLNVMLVFLWIFGLANILNSGINMAINIDCLLTGGPQPFPFEQIISIICHTAEILFCIGQLGFLSIYGKYRFKLSSLINLGTSFMVIAHTIRWCRSFCYSIFMEHKLPSLNTTDDCFDNSSLNDIQGAIYKYAGPIKTEFSLLSVVVVVRMFAIFDKDSCNETEASSTRQTSSCHSAEHEYSSSTSWKKCDMERRPISFSLSIVIGIILSLPYTIANVLPSLDTSTYRVISLTYNSEMLLLLCIAYRQFKVQFQDNCNRQTETITYHPVLIFVTAGAITYTTFGCIAGIMLSSQPIGRTLLVDKIIESIVILFQTILILHVQTFCLKKAYVRMTSSKVHHTFLCIFVMNTIHWTLSTFAFGQLSDARTIQKEFYGENYWRVIVNMMFPIMMFYRLITAIEMYELYKKTSIYFRRLI